jgi:cytochrome c peroxidase
VTFERVSEALSAFQRTLVSYNSKFDRYAAGDFTALNASEKNGLMLFRSLHTRCFECHTFPTFSDGSFRVVGVRGEGEPDKGRGGAMPNGAADHSFKVPSLRNVALTAPYMHNGSLATLEEVVKFYSEGGGRREADPVPDIDDKVKKFDMTPQENRSIWWRSWRR